ncbi:HlyD family efflux transporter periplasmic adaptor subunit [Stenotrophomonas indicatrix]|uniref:HlyD family secretion protein n=1 Tax=Stenotrophomonas indicatrix TaxID=2045451 RepID=UPI00215A523D|nr:HlyD family efflux transporter periplasmic adaptor subunit [Stenotrophomonas indicatrix]MCR8713103.1 HlyD family efflux transporter periplasmic adaptor subunit [Stenotrophomonas indicatrix]
MSMRFRRAVLAVSVIAIAAAAVFLAFEERVTTEDAFVEGNVVAVTSQVGGVVTSISNDSTEHVLAGAELIRLDDTDARLALGRAEAMLARSVRQVRSQTANVGQARANLRGRQVELRRAQVDLRNRLALQPIGAVSGEEAQHAKDDVERAEASAELALQQLNAGLALIDGFPIEQHPDVLAAAANVREAFVALRRTRVPAPVGGILAKRSVQIGQRVSAGVAMMSIVPLDQIWVSANFKESQLRHIRSGQPVTLKADVYGAEVTYSGTVIGQDAGTGSAFALLPAQNATGNWIKVVQRVPVRISLDAAEVARHPLQLGLSMRVTIDTSSRDGLRLQPMPGETHPRYVTNVFAQDVANADELVNRIITTNR